MLSFSAQIVMQLLCQEGSAPQRGSGLTLNLSLEMSFSIFLDLFFSTLRFPKSAVGGVLRMELA